MPAVARVGDHITHGGTVVSGSPSVFADSTPVARLGDAVHCNLHGAQTITTASMDVFANNIGVARFGDKISCGAFIRSGSPDVFIDEVIHGMLGVTTLRPPPGTDETYTGPWIVTGPAGEAVSTAGTATQGMQEWINYGVLTGTPMRLFGRTGNTSSDSGTPSTMPPLFIISTPIVMPVLFQQDIDFSNCNIIYTGGDSQPVVLFDSCMMTRIQMGGQVITNGTGPAIRFQPRNQLDIDVRIAITDSRFFLGSFGANGGGGADTALIEWDCEFASILDSYFSFIEAECANLFAFGMSAKFAGGPSPPGTGAGTTVFRGNRIDATHIHGFTSCGFLLGGHPWAGTTFWGANYTGNNITLTELVGGGVSSVGINCFGNYNNFYGGEINNEEGGLHDGIIITSNDSAAGGNGNSFIGWYVTGQIANKYVDGTGTNFKFGGNI